MSTILYTKWRWPEFFVNLLKAEKGPCRKLWPLFGCERAANQHQSHSCSSPSILSFRFISYNIPKLWVATTTKTWSITRMTDPSPLQSMGCLQMRWKKKIKKTSLAFIQLASGTFLHLHIMLTSHFFLGRDFLLKPELLRAISDLGFEHPSEGRISLRVLQLMVDKLCQQCNKSV